MNFPTTKNYFLEALCKNGVPTKQDDEYAEALSKLSEMNYQAGYEAGLLKQKTHNT